jgi:hypothetical protein
VATSQSCDDAGVAQLIWELSASLDPPQRRAFEAAARAVLAATGCSGPGAAFRLLAPLQRDFFDPPSDARAISGARHQRRRPSKLSQADPIGAPDPREDGRARRALRAV